MNYREIVNILLRLTFLINLLTVFGSVISFIIFSRKIFKQSSIGFYCKSLAIFDLFVLFIMGFGIAGQILNVQLIASNDNICKFVFFISISTSPIQGWILIVFSIDELITVSMIGRFGFIKNQWFKYTITLFIFIFHCGLYSPVFVSVGRMITTINNVTYYNCVIYSIGLEITYFLEASCIPFVIMIILTVRIIKILIASRRRASLQPFNRALNRRVRHLKYAFNSVILNILFILFTTPLVVFYMFPISDFRLSALINVVCFLFFYLNFALHFWVHLFVNSYFRNELLVLFRIRKGRKNSIFNKNFNS